MSTEKPMSGFARKKALEANGCSFHKVTILTKTSTTKQEVWECRMGDDIVASSRLQGDCVNAAIEALGGL